MSDDRLRRSLSNFAESMTWDVHPQGVVMVPQMSVLIDNCQFLTEEDLSILADQHDLDAVTLYRFMSRCPSRPLLL